MQVHGANNNDPRIRTDVPRAEGNAVERPHLESTQALQSRSDANDTSAVRSRSPELVKLLEQLQETPEARAELVARVVQKLANGEYLTRDAARQAATNIVKGI